MSAEVVDVLRRARERISTPRKWCKGAFRDDSAADDDHCRVCAAGAINYAVNRKPERSDRTQPAKRWLAEVIGEGLIGDFNDAPKTKHADVLAAFDRAIALAEAAS